MKIICVGRNFVEHAKELGNELPTEPVIFIKPSTSLVNNTATVNYPHFTNELHYEIELVLKIGKNGKFINKTSALHCISDITVGIDFTARDKQNELKKNSLPWEKAKAFDGSAYVGKWIATDAKELKKEITFSLYKNGEQVQLGNTNLMIYNFATIIEDVSQYFSLQIGDLIFTGTPKGVGECLPEDILDGYLNDKKLFSVKIK